MGDTLAIGLRITEGIEMVMKAQEEGNMNKLARIGGEIIRKFESEGLTVQEMAMILKHLTLSFVHVVDKFEKKAENE